MYRVISVKVQLIHDELKFGDIVECSDITLGSLIFERKRKRRCSHWLHFEIQFTVYIKATRAATNIKEIKSLSL